MHSLFRLSRTLVSRSTVARVTLSSQPTYLSFNQTAWKHIEAATAASPPSVTAADTTSKEETVTKETSDPSSGLNEAATSNVTNTSPIAEFRWDDIVEEVVEKVEITGAILPWSELNFVQKLFCPYTYSVMHYLDFLSDHLPWWAAILGTSATIKFLFLPLVVKQQKIGIRTHNIQPEMQKIQADLNEATLMGDSYQVALNRAKLGILFKEHNVTIAQRLWPSLIQAPMFMSFFFLLRKLTEALPELHHSGILWFSDLTLPDPLMILPLTTCLSTFLMIELGIGSETSPNASIDSLRPMARWFFRVIPIGMFFLVYKFPAATLLFWASSNFLSLVFSILIRLPALRTLLRMPTKLKHDPKDLPLSNQTLMGQLKSAQEMSRKSKTSMDLRRLDDLAFKKAGVGPLKKTYDKPPNPAGDGKS